MNRRYVLVGGLYALSAAGLGWFGRSRALARDDPLRAAARQFVSHLRHRWPELYQRIAAGGHVSTQTTSHFHEVEGIIVTEADLAAAVRLTEF